MGNSMSKNICVSMRRNLSIGISKYKCESERDYEQEYDYKNEYRYEFMNTSLSIILNVCLSSNINRYMNISGCMSELMGPSRIKL